MTSDLRIGYPDIPFFSTPATESNAYSATLPAKNLILGPRRTYAQLAAAVSGVSWLQYYVAATAQANYLALLRANILAKSGVTTVQVHRSSISWAYPGGLSGCVLHLDAGRGVTYDSTNRVSSWVDLISGHDFVQSTAADRPVWSRADNLANWVEYSQQFSNAYWTLGRATVADNQIAEPLSGTTTAATLTATATTGPHQIAIETSARPYVWANVSCRVSGYFKYNNYQYVWFGLDAGTPSAAVIDIQNGTISSTSGLTASSITSVGNGWYRVELTFTLAAAANVALIAAFGTAAAASGGVPSWTAVGTEKFYFWGIQLHEAAADTTYIATENSHEARGINGKPAIKFLPTDLLSIATTPAALNITGDITIFAVSRRMGTLGTAQYLLNCMSGSASGYRFAIAGGAQQPIFETANGSTSSLTATSATTQNNVEVLALTRSSGTATHYLDNASNGSGAVSNPASASANPITISNGSSTIQGYICELLVYNRAVTGTERDNIYAYLRDKWQTAAEYTQHRLDLETLLGPDSEDWIETFTMNSAAEYWVVTFWSRQQSYRPLGKLFLGQLFDFDRDPVYGRKFTAEFESDKIRAPANRFGLTWEGVTSAKRNDFIYKIGQYQDVSPVVLTSSSGAESLLAFDLLYCDILNTEFSTRPPATHDIDIEFKEAK